MVVPLLKGVVYRENDATVWNGLVHGQAQVRDYVAVLGLELVLDEAEGQAFLRSRSDGDGGGDGVSGGAAPPRLVARRPLSFPVSLLLALLRKRLAELDAGGGDTRLVLTRDEIVEMVRVFLPDTSNEARLIDRIDTHLNRIVELGFLRRDERPDRATSARTGGADDVRGSGVSSRRSWTPNGLRNSTCASRSTAPWSKVARTMAPRDEGSGADRSSGSGGTEVRGGNREP